jgi:hypothetical protein
MKPPKVHLSLDTRSLSVRHHDDRPTFARCVLWPRPSSPSGRFPVAYDTPSAVGLFCFVSFFSHIRSKPERRFAMAQTEFCFPGVLLSGRATVGTGFLRFDSSCPPPRAGRDAHWRSLVFLLFLSHRDIGEFFSFWST